VEVKQLTRSGFMSRLACPWCGSLDINHWEIPEEASEALSQGGKKVAEERFELYEIREVLERLCQDVEGGSPEVIDQLIDYALEELSAYLK
jgi:hypothetical protein